MKIDHQFTHLKLHILENRGRNRKHVEGVRDSKIREERRAAPVKFLKWKRAEFFDTKEHPKRDGQLYKWHQEHRQRAHAGFFIDAVLLERDRPHPDLVAHPVRFIELCLEQPRPMQCECC